MWKESWEIAKNPMASRGSPLHGPRIKLIEKAQNLFAETKEHVFESKAAEEHAKLLRYELFFKRLKSMYMKDKLMFLFIVSLSFYI